MNIVSVLLIAGLVYVAMQQKKVSNRNVMLVVTGLLAFCMLGLKEGFYSVFDGESDQVGMLDAAVQITDSSDSLIIYDFPIGFKPRSVTSKDNALPSANTPTCKIDGTPGEISAMDPWPAHTDALAVIGLNINTVYKCDPVAQDQGCTGYTGCPPTSHLLKTGNNLPVDGAPSTTLCCDTKALCSTDTTSTCTAPAVKKTGDTALCAGATCDAADFGDKAAACCRAPDADESCINAGDDLDSYNNYGDFGEGCSIFNSDEGAKCGTFFWMTQNCDSSTV